MTLPTAGPSREETSQPAAKEPAFRCATWARDRGDPLAGSAAPARRWLLIEHPGPWNEQAMRSRPLDSRAGQSIAEAAATAGARILLIRRPWRPRGHAKKAWAVVVHGQGATWGHWEVPEDLVRAKGLLAGHVEPRGEQGPLFLVCAHGRRDVCCAVRGRPVARALAARWPRQTWECSHLGGDRFAANVLVVPDGTTYGRLGEQDCVRVLEAHLRGEVDTTHLRGCSVDPPVAQAAAVDALRRWGPAGPLDARPTSVRATSRNEWLVELSGSGPLPEVMTATVTRRRRPAELLTCRAATAKTADEYAVQWSPVGPVATPPA